MASLILPKVLIATAQLWLIAGNARAQADSPARADSLLHRVQQLSQRGDTASLRAALAALDSVPTTHRPTVGALRTLVAFPYAAMLLNAAQQSNSCVLAKESERLFLLAQQHIPATSVDIPQLRAHLEALSEHSDSLRAVLQRTCTPA